LTGARRLVAVWGALALWLIVAGRAAADGPEVRFGAVDAYMDGARADELGVRWSRLMFPWQRVQRVGPNEWWPAIADDIINDEVKRGRRLVGVLVNTPDWASSGVGRTYTSPPKNLNLPIDSSENYWAAYVRRSAAAYRGRVDTWVVWNEPDVWDPAHPGYTWAGSVEDFYQLQKVAYLAAHKGNPDAKVLLPGLTYFWDKRGDKPQYLQRLLDIAAKDPEAPANGWFFDAAVLQLYNDPQLLYDVPLEYRKIMREHGLDKPIWINETNVAPWDDFDRPLTRAHFRANADEQASYLIQAYSLALAAGVERIEVYKLRDDAEWQFGWESYGVVRADRTIRPGGRALQMVHGLFNAVHGGAARVVNGVAVVTLARPDGRATVLWAKSPRPATAKLVAIAPSATVYYRDGTSRQVDAVGGQYQLDLPGATHNTVEGKPNEYQIGGAPIIVVEKGGAVEAQVDVALGDAPLPVDGLGVLARLFDALHFSAPAFAPNGR
jgi:hypothetical protein